MGALRRDLSAAPVIDNYWIVASGNLHQLNRSIRETIRSARQRDHLRAALDRMDPELSSSLGNDTAFHQRLSVSGRNLASIPALACDAIISRNEVEKDREKDLKREQAARIQAEEASRLNDEFLAVLSHELRTPLNSILGWVHIMRTGQLDAETKAKALEVIERNTKLQAQLIQDLIDVSDLMSEKVQLQRETVQLSAIINQALETVRPAAESKSIGLEVQVDGFVEPVQGDARRLRQMIESLLSSAVKFSAADGKIQIALAKTATEAEIRIAGSDIGVPTESLPHLFNYFRQTDSATSRALAGLRLGLTVVRRLAELHDGTVRAESAGNGGGAAFIILLPLLSSARPLAASEIPDLRKVLNGVTVLLADDEAETRTVLATLLEQAGAAVTAAGTSSDAADSLHRSIPDVVLLDIAMPREDGYMLLEKIRKHPGCNDVPAVALTGYAGEEDRRRAKAAGFHVHLAKPVDPAELIQTISKLIHSGVGR
jgi:signal transduction histidine kinase/CheY-like chemotaxis protein